MDFLYSGPFDVSPIEDILKSTIDNKAPHEGVVVRTDDMNKIAKFISPLFLEFQSKKEDSTDFH